MLRRRKAARWQQEALLPATDNRLTEFITVGAPGIQSGAPFFVRVRA
jgi:hypothetical protein